MNRPVRAAWVALAFFFTLAGCTSRPADNAAAPEGGAAGDTPARLVLGFVPSQEADKIAETAQPMADFVSQELGIPVETFTSTNYVGLVEAMGSGKVDIGALAPLAYVLANRENGAQVILKTSRKGAVTYHTMFVARADSGIKSIEQARGKRVAWVDPASASGYLFPFTYLKDRGYDPETFFAEQKFAGAHDVAVRGVYNGDFDVAAVYDDARNSLAKSLPDVKQKVVKIGQTEEIPNDTISVRKGLDPALVERIKQAFLKYAQTDAGQKTLMDVYEIDGLTEAKDSDYDIVRKAFDAMNLTRDSVK